MDKPMHDIVVITGPTATGKTRLAALVADRLGGEVISADSRQVYRGMDIGTGKDLSDYIVDGRRVPVHMVDIVDAGYRYNVYEYQRDFLRVFEDMSARDVFPVVCGGSGMYVDSIVSGYRLVKVPVNAPLRALLAERSLDELTVMLSHYKNLHNKTDVDTVKRAIRAIEIADYYANHPVDETPFPVRNPLVMALFVDRETRRQRISDRLRARLDEGMIEEVQRLLAGGIHPDDLIYYGLEYKYITLYLTNRLTRDEMIQKLEVEIHRFAKRQMTWFRGMERRGITINWIDGNMSDLEKTDHIIARLHHT
ncbi:MAG TPA: tRNA (adenosine(37)-N6)-dimethylallyltransferase MiaA [Bacteroidales bacterium]|jgi:tRNA dimethylallyltransferase|nr:tRNA (adenosine(37)-N6)-dimethylallyltransferase MiaA [Bacteroidales bacterium]MDI9533710.1 tRNA (adenosine(37)-N6)-dimethylallyltransferase MiaA [Bacteroidota bacterium]MBP7036164.1 tRNA (adenosine(37)-N6)-dimethylallyltransferase MiaA [Bacteroidales bacterium]MBP8709373.1 tRNA (adenosine(37)-N6)-dimethylallyltransferase MiaA [Bacteroidales bacterium]MZQ79124.1 tRNA (adenosine(37)-N6)-dimethylallyltransferase MiaA [Bacteroidales bacterium]